jgi:hypothetical protein
MIPRFDSVPLGDATPDKTAHHVYDDALAEAGGQGAVWETPEQIPVPPLYTEADLTGLDFLDTRPGLPPFLRGPYATMYVNRPWTIRQYAGLLDGEPSPTPSTAATWRPARRACRSPSTSPPTAATTPITRAWPATSAWPAWPSTRSSTCVSCSKASRSTRCRCR